MQPIGALTAASASSTRFAPLEDEATFIPTDVTRAEDVSRLAKETEKRFGRIDVLCNNAGVGLLRTVVESTEEEYDYVMDVNVRGVFLCCKYFLPAMLRQAGSSVINMASVASFVGFPRDAAYCASKGAVLMLTRQLAVDYSQAGVRVNAICPGFIETPQLQYYVAEQEDPERLSPKSHLFTRSAGSDNQTRSLLRPPFWRATRRRS